MKAALILVVDDEPQIRRVLRTSLSAGGYTMMEARTAEEAIEKIRQEPPDLVILDINMPGMGGLEGCREIRESSDVPIIMLSVRGSERDKVRALDAGADDYVVKPFSSQELLARIRANLRRSAQTDESQLAAFSSSDLSIDFERRLVTSAGKKVHLTPKEFEVLRCLVTGGGQPITHRALLQAVWGPDYGEETEYLRVCVNHLRKKIEPDPANPRYIVTEPWVGYRFVSAP
jgi:two-component system KDP operon response regulator KdpE